MKCTVGFIRWFNAKFGKQQGSALSSFPLAIVVIKLTERIREEMILCRVERARKK